jgi:hypothetical protein
LLRILSLFRKLVPGTSRRAIQSGQVAQLVERSPEKAGVGGSIPSLATIKINGLQLICLPDFAPKIPTLLAIAIATG